MSRFAAYALSLVLIALSSHAMARTPETPQMSGGDSGLSDLTDLRIEVVKNALNLSPEQLRYWPAIEDAIRARAEARSQRLERLNAALDEPQGDRDFVKALQRRAANLSERSANLKRLADAWQPLYATLDATQKQRMRLLAVLVLHRIGDELNARRDEIDDDDMWGMAEAPPMGMPMNPMPMYRGGRY